MSPFNIARICDMANSVPLVKESYSVSPFNIARICDWRTAYVQLVCQQILYFFLLLVDNG